LPQFVGHTLLLSVDHFIEMPQHCDTAAVWLLALGTSDLDLCVGEGTQSFSIDIGSHHVGLVMHIHT